MDYFKQFVDSLPSVLNPEEQERLLLNYFETKDGDLREKLLEHNLRLCMQCTLDFCRRYNMSRMQEDIFSICYDQLSKSLERFNPAEETSFAHFAYKNMRLTLYRHMQNQDYYNSFFVDTVKLADNKEGDESEVFYFLHGDVTVQDEVFQDMFREDIINFIDQLRGSANKKEMVKMYLGLGYPKQYTKAEIAGHFQCSRENSSATVSKYLKLVQQYIAQKYGSVYPDYAKRVNNNSPKFKSTSERNQYILKSYYNEDGAKSIGEIARELAISKSCIYEVVRREKDADKENKLQHNRKAKNPYNLERIESIFNDWYGINSSRILSKQELIRKYKLPLADDSYSHALKRIEDILIAEGKYTAYEIQEIKRTRVERLKEERLEMFKVIYHSARGDEGYEHKSIAQLAKEYHVATGTIQVRIKLYKDYLASKSNTIDDQTEYEE